MTVAEVYTSLCGINGYSGKVAFEAFPEQEAPSLPYLIMFETGQRTFSADGIVYYSAHQIQIEQYTEQKDIAQEALVQAKLTEMNAYYTQESGYDETEQAHLTIYRIEV